MAKFGFKFMQEEPKTIIEIDETETDKVNKCIFCNAETDLVLEHDIGIAVYIPICEKHYSKVIAKEKVIEFLVNSLKQFIKS